MLPQRNVFRGCAARMPQRMRVRLGLHSETALREVGGLLGSALSLGVELWQRREDTQQCTRM